MGTEYSYSVMTDDGKEETGETLFHIDTDCPVEMMFLVNQILSKKGVLNMLKDGVFSFKEIEIDTDTTGGHS
jgi:hypothetical protein